MFSREDWTLFRTLETLPQKAGVSLAELPGLVAKELADNALDFAGSCQCGPLANGGFYIANPGDGLPGTPEEIAYLFSIKRPLTSSKLWRLPTRGALGNGLRVVAGYALATDSGLFVSANGNRLRLRPQDNGETLAEIVGVYEGEGTRIELHTGRDMNKALAWAKFGELMAHGEYYRGKHSPFWYNADSFFELAQAAGNRSIRELLTEFDGCSGSVAGNLAADYRGRLASSLARDEAEDLLCAARSVAKPVKAERLGEVGIFAGDAPTVAYAKVMGLHREKAGRGKLDVELPFVIEAWVDFNMTPGIVACVNRTPIVPPMRVNPDKKAGAALHGCNIHHYIAELKQCPSIRLNIITPYIAKLNDGKTPDLLPYLPAIGEVLKKASARGKRLRGGLSEKALTEKAVFLAHLDECVAHASGDGQYRFSVRQLFYAVRPFIMEEAGKPNPSYDNFNSILTDYEKEYGDLPGIYRDPRGTLYHPHTGETISLGTRAVEAYERPEWTFNKILYCEKEGFFEILKAAQWPERNDCALLSSKGYASRAARDVCDLLGDTAEELEFFCVHDADAYGTMIYQSLQDATKARQSRRVKVINLGLEPEEALEAGLAVEQVASKDKKPVAEYVPTAWKEWLQTQRVELNAMTTPQFIAWLDAKFATHSKGLKVIPPDAVLLDHLKEASLEEAKTMITDRLLREAGFDDLVDRAEKDIEEMVAVHEETLRDQVTVSLAATPENRWTEPIEEIAAQIGKEFK